MLLHAEAICLAVLAVILAGPGSAALASARWTARSPRAALVLWQAVGLGGGLGVLSAGLTLAAGSLENRWLPGIFAIPSRWHRLGFWGGFGIGLTACVGIYLISATITSTLRILAARREHRNRLDVISRALEVSAGDGARAGTPIRLIDHPHAVAYCLPGFRPRVVLTQGALDVLADPELGAVLAHEHAHARGRHDLVIQPFIAWERTFPVLRPARSAVRAVALLVEMLADDAALKRCGRATLHSALGKLSGQHVAIGGSDSGAWRRQMQARLARIEPDAPQAWPWARAAAIYAAAVLLVVAPPVVLLFS